MADICKCYNKECPLKESCFRFLAEDSHYQTYAEFKHENCEDYWHVKDKEELKQLNFRWRD